MRAFLGGLGVGMGWGLVTGSVLLLALLLERIITAPEPLAPVSYTTVGGAHYVINRECDQ